MLLLCCIAVIPSEYFFQKEEYTIWKEISDSGAGCYRVRNEMLLLWRKCGASCGHILPASCQLDLTCENGVVRSGRLELVQNHTVAFIQLSGNARKDNHNSMATLDQKSPNVLLQSLCCRITGKSEGTSVNSSMLRASTGSIMCKRRCHSEPHSKIRLINFAFPNANRTCVTHQVKASAESVSSTGKFGYHFHTRKYTLWYK